MSDLMSPGRRIRHYRMLRGMTQKTLGIAAGFPPETADIRIAQYESGARTPKHALLCTLAEALGVSPSALDIPRIKSREALNQLLLALEDEYGLTVTITENNERSICNIGIRSGSHVPVQVRTTKMAVSGCLSKLLVSLV